MLGRTDVTVGHLMLKHKHQGERQDISTALSFSERAEMVPVIGDQAEPCST